MSATDPTTLLVVLAAVAVGIVVLIALARRMGWIASPRQAWSDVWRSAADAVRTIRSRPRVVYPAAILAAVTVASLPLRAAYLAWSGYLRGPYWQVAAQYVRFGTGRDVVTEAWLLSRELPQQPGRVAGYLAGRFGPFGILEPLLVAVALAALVVTLGAWVPPASDRQAGASARLLRWLLAPLIVLVGVQIFQRVALVNLAGKSLPLIVLFSLPVVLDAAVEAGIAAALFTAARRALDAQDPWAPSPLAWGALRHFRALFLLTLWLYGLWTLEWVVQTWLGWYGAAWVMWTAMACISVALMLAPAIIVSQGVGVIESVRLAFRAWLRAPVHFILVLAGGMAIMWAGRLLPALLLAPLGESLAAGLVIHLAWPAAHAVVVTGSAVLALLLWQRLRDRVTPDRVAAL